MDTRVPRRALIVTKMQPSKKPLWSISVNWSRECCIKRILLYYKSSLSHLGLKSPLYSYAMKSAFCCYQSPEGRGCYPWGQFCAGALPTLFVATVKVCVKAFEGMECTNVYIFATRPSIKVPSMLFTLQLLISVLCRI